MTIDWRPAEPTDAEALQRVVEVSQRADGDPEIAPVEDLVADLTSERTDLAGDTIVAWAGDTAVAYGFIHCSEQPGPNHHWAWLLANCDPAHRAELDAELYDRLIALGTARLRAAVHDVPKFLRVPLVEGATARRTLVEGLGFELVRWFDVMRHDLVELREPATPDGVDFVNWSDEFESSSLTAHNLAFADHWGSPPQTEVQWHEHTAGNEFLRRDLTFLALDPDDRRVLAYLIASVWPAEPGEVEAWADTIGTVPEARGRGLASALIDRFLRRAAADPGIDVAGLDVDSDSQTGARALYERAGFRLLHRQVQYARPVT